MKNIESKIPEFKVYLQSKDIVTKALPFLYRFSVTDDDIINMTNVVVDYLDGKIAFKPNLQSENIQDENKIIKKPYYWKSLIHEIRNLGDINSQIINQRYYLESIRIQIDNLNFQRQKLNEQTLLSAQLLNSLNVRFYGLMEIIKQIMFAVKDPKKMLHVYHLLFLYILPQAVIRRKTINIKKKKAYENQTKPTCIS